ncbi:MAG: hypothetical protein ACFFB5_02705 [Promethearchaeota archaeon]
MTEPRPSHSEAIAGVKIKRFLTMAVMKLSQELIDRSDTLETRKSIETMINDLVKSSFTLTSSDNTLTQAKLFLASLGFSPCEIEWAEDVRLGRVLLGRGRIWRATTEKDAELIKLLLLAIVKGLGYSFVESNVKVSFIENELLPPRFAYELQFRASEDVFAESVQPTAEEKKEVLLSAGSLLNPILGRGISIQDATRFLLEGTRTVVEEYEPAILERKDIEDYPLKLIEVFYLKLQEDERLEELAHQIGVLMVRSIRQTFHGIERHQILKGIGLLPPDEIDELLFYGDVDICGKDRGKNISFCRFLGHIWSGYASEVLGKKFRMTEDPLCATKTGTKCIFTLEGI